MCGTPALFEYLATRKVQEHIPSRPNTLICYTDRLDEPRKWLLQEEEGGINATGGKSPMPYSNPRCLRGWPVGCKEESWDHPEMGMLCLCKEHAEEVFRGEAKAPPIRMTRDYQPVGMKTFIFDSNGKLK